MSFLFNQDDPLIDEATSDQLPIGQPDLHLNFQIADKIKSSKLSPQKALSQIQKRLQNANPNVVLLTLELVDCLVKNSGHLFIQELVTESSLNQLQELLNGKKQVRDKVLDLIQQWTFLLKDNDDYYLLALRYKQLKNQGHEFPPEPKQLPTALVETVLAPPWVDGDSCKRCRTVFTTFNRKHHCRNCGGIYCGNCSSKTSVLLRLGITEPVRVCETCYGKIQAGVVDTPPKNQRDQSSVVKDDDMEAAIRASLQDHKLPAKVVSHQDDEDEDLKRAIEASLKESTSRQRVESQKPSLYSQINQPTQSPVQPAVSIIPKRIPHITPQDLETLNLVCRLLESNELPKPHLYENAIQIHQKLLLELQQVSDEYSKIYGIYGEVGESLEAYDGLLKKRFSNVPSSPGVMGGYPGQVYQSGPIGQSVPGYGQAQAYTAPPANSGQQYAAQPVQGGQPYSPQVHSGQPYTAQPVQASQPYSPPAQTSTIPVATAGYTVPPQQVNPSQAYPAPYPLAQGLPTQGYPSQPLYSTQPSQPYPQQYGSQPGHNISNFSPVQNQPVAQQPTVPSIPNDQPLIQFD